MRTAGVASLIFARPSLESTQSDVLAETNFAVSSMH